MYLLPNSSHSLNTDKFASVFYVVVIPMLNPLIEESGSKECTEENYRKVPFDCQITEKIKDREVSEDLELWFI